MPALIATIVFVVVSLGGFIAFSLLDERKSRARVLHDRLNSTVLIVTHDNTVAESCPRTITLRDARIAGDVRR